MSPERNEALNRFHFMRMHHKEFYNQSVDEVLWAIGDLHLRLAEAYDAQGEQDQNEPINWPNRLRSFLRPNNAGDTSKYAFTFARFFGLGSYVWSSDLTPARFESEVHEVYTKNNIWVGEPPLEVALAAAAADNPATISDLLLRLDGLAVESVETVDLMVVSGSAEELDNNVMIAGEPRPRPRYPGFEINAKLRIRLDVPFESRLLVLHMAPFPSKQLTLIAPSRWVPEVSFEKGPLDLPTANPKGHGKVFFVAEPVGWHTVYFVFIDRGTELDLPLLRHQGDLLPLTSADLGALLDDLEDLAENTGAGIEVHCRYFHARAGR